MKAYLIQTSSGSYEDYYSRIHKVFLDKDKSQEYVDRYNIKLKSEQDQETVCNECRCAKYSYLSQVIRNCKRGARPSDISEIDKIDSNLYFECEKEIGDYREEDHPATIIEMEIEE